MYQGERRIFERFRANFSAEVKHFGSQEANPAKCRDVSASGVGVVSEQEFIPNINLEICLGIPNGHPPFRGKARVVWSKKMGEDRWHTGLEFKKPDLMGIRRVLPL